MTELERAERELYIEQNKLTVLEKERERINRAWFTQEAKAAQARGRVYDLKKDAPSPSQPDQAG
ncbi:MAG: hypothetical protein AAFY24_02050 [Pseudomonadota bacterium]